MKKHGFTLAEVLVTLGIIGVVSALVMPTFTASVKGKRIGPTLAKAKASFEQGTQRMLYANETNSISSMNFNNGSVETFLGTLRGYMKGAVDPHGTVFIANDGVAYGFTNKKMKVLTTFDTPHLNNITGKKTSEDPVFYIDIDGENNGAGEDAKDIFYFTLMDDGSLVPWGSALNGDTGGMNWSEAKGCQSGKIPADATKCAAHVLENGLKVEYKI